jgi:hypothetical protein
VNYTIYYKSYVIKLNKIRAPEYYDYNSDVRIRNFYEVLGYRGCTDQKF